MARGGKRPGAGRPKGSKEQSTLTKEAAREALRQIVLQDLRGMTEAQMAAAKGIKYLVYRNRIGGEFKVATKELLESGALGGENVIVEVWDKQPSTPAFTDLMNRALDKPKEQVQELAVTVDSRADRVLAARQRLQNGK
jgi:hypothetical protein